MAIKQYNPTTPGRRGMTSQDFDGITTKKPLKSLLVAKRRGNGRNNQGRITTRHPTRRITLWTARSVTPATSPRPLDSRLHRTLATSETNSVS